MFVSVRQMLAEAERTCGELQQAASRLEGRLAELDRWSTEALDCHQHLKEKKHRGRSALDPTAKVSEPKLCAPSNYLTIVVSMLKTSQIALEPFSQKQFVGIVNMQIVNGSSITIPK